MEAPKYFCTSCGERLVIKKQSSETRYDLNTGYEKTTTTLKLGCPKHWWHTTLKVDDSENGYWAIRVNEDY